MRPDGGALGMLRWAGKVVTKACCQYWCSTCLLLKIVSALPHLPKCSRCNLELSTVQSTDFEDNGDTVVRTATFQETYKWRVAERVRAWLKKPAEERRGDMAVQVWLHPCDLQYEHPVPMVFQSVLPKDVALCGFMADGNAISMLLAHLHTKIFGAPRTVPVYRDCQSLEEFEKYARQATDPLTRILRTLVMGDPLQPAVERLASNFFTRKGISAVQIAVDVLSKSSCNGYIGPTQTLLRWAVDCNDKSKREFLLRALSLTSKGRGLNREQAARLYDEWVRRPRDNMGPEYFSHMGGDNCGWKQQAGGDAEGGGSGFDPWQIPIKFYTTRDELKALAGPDRNLLLPASHVRKTAWVDGAEAIYDLKPEDWCYMRRRRAEMHEWAVRVGTLIAENGGLVRSTKSLTRLNMHVPVHWTTPYNASDGKVRQLCTTRGTRSACPSHFAAQGAQTDFTCHVDPAKTSVLADILDRQRACMEGEVSRHAGAEAGAAKALDTDGQIKHPAAHMRMLLKNP